MAVGEYVGGQGFPLPNPVSMHREYPRLRFRAIELRSALLQKTKTPGALIEKYGMGAKDIIYAVKNVLKRKK